MSQIDKIHFLPTLIWVVIGYVAWYGYILMFVVPKYYKVMRVRYYLEIKVWERINEIIMSIEQKRIFFLIWQKSILKKISIRVSVKKIEREIKITKKI